MHKLFITSIGLALILPSAVFSQVEEEIKSTISSVTVYAKGAQIVNQADVLLIQRKMLLKFTNLSPYINKESIRIESGGNFTILNVQHKNDYINKLVTSKKIEDLNNAIESTRDKQEDGETLLKILKEKQEFLTSNKNVAGKEQTINPDAFKSLIEIYGSNTEKLNLEILKTQRQIKVYGKEIANLQSQLNEISGKQDLPSGEISVLVSSDHPVSSKIQISYITDNAEWYPSYDIRYMAADKPVLISYKANIKQSTGVDWVNVKLRLSNAKTQLSAEIPELNPLYLQFYRSVANAIQGRVPGLDISNNSEIRIRGMASLKSAPSPLYVVDGETKGNIDYLDPDEIAKVDVIKDASATLIYGSRGANGVVIVTTNKNKAHSYVPRTIVSKNEITKEFIVDDVQSILSDGKLNTIKFRDAEVKANYEFKTVPKKSEHVYLVGKICDWYNTDLSDGEVNLYAENSFVGQSNINTTQFSDTLDISFGIDNGISVKREKIKDYSESKLLGSNKKENIGWKIKIRNNKGYEITTNVVDQIPTSTNKDIQIEALEISGGNWNEITGEVQWNLKLKPNETKEVILKYALKYPKNEQVIID
jgi:TonB-dependent SusC/RagA subfamily outer membrane receptor